MKACPDTIIQNKDIKMLVALLPTLKMFLSVEMNSEVIEAAARSCLSEKVLSKVLKKFTIKYLCWSLFLEK